MSQGCFQTNKGKDQFLNVFVALYYSASKTLVISKVSTGHNLLCMKLNLPKSGLKRMGLGIGTNICTRQLEESMKHRKMLMLRRLKQVRLIVILKNNKIFKQNCHFLSVKYMLLLLLCYVTELFRSPGKGKTIQVSR